MIKLHYICIFANNINNTTLYSKTAIVFYPKPGYNSSVECKELWTTSVQFE